MDGTLANYEGPLREELSRISSPGEPDPKIGWDDSTPWIEARKDLIKSQPGWWESLPEIPSGFVLYRLLREVGFSIHVLTKGPRRTANAWTEKFRWCRTHLPSDVSITITHDKGLVYGRVLVDDFPPYMDRWLKFRPRGLGLMIATDYNVDYRHPNVIRYSPGIRYGDEECIEIKKVAEAAFRRGRA